MILDGTTARETDDDREADNAESVREEKPHNKLTVKVLNAVIPDSVEDKHAARRKILRGLGIALSLGIALLALFELTRTFMQIDVGDLRDAIAATSGERFVVAFLCTAVSFLALTGYDALALRQLKLKVPYPTTALASFTSYAISFTLGFPLITAGHGALHGSIRRRAFPPARSPASRSSPGSPSGSAWCSSSASASPFARPASPISTIWRRT